jgi:hypothetical protein|uniref:Uncharacterized protein n=1 Tax=Myoviridae sp. ctu2j3 TaxID=2825197 RepID=A0A8S5UIY3_9CAUD|nr:MAG TPA: hypothetical protein [Myoviridae sp. ctu2j3]DAF94326.1 MAG TPA: hypothetical protein [Myoviridae sp. ctu2j3]
MVTKRAKNGAQSTTCMGTISPFIKKMDHTIYYHERRSLEVGSVERSDTHSTGDQHSAGDARGMGCRYAPSRHAARVIDSRPIRM